MDFADPTIANASWEFYTSSSEAFDHLAVIERDFCISALSNNWGIQLVKLRDVKYIGVVILKFNNFACVMNLCL